MVFVPTQVAQAGFLSAIFGDPVNADVSTSAPVDNSQNLQNLPLLSAGIAPSSDTSSGSGSSVNIVADSAIQPSMGPMGVSDGSTSDSSNYQTSVYVVRSGDSLAQIAQMFNVSTDTILWANGLKKGQALTPGQVLLILPVSGVEHVVTKGQTLQGIAKIYKVDVSDIIQSNDITIDTPLNVGDTLIIPNGEKSVESDKPLTSKAVKASVDKSKLYYEQHPTAVYSNYYIDPVPGYRLSQGIHDNNAVDLAISKGTPIHAAASGTVLLARYGYNGGFGNVVIINHPNGTQTLYAHQSKLAVTSGENVSQGQVIGYVGSTGHSTGPHLHFEVHGAKNPGVDDSWEPWNY